MHPRQWAAVCEPHRTRLVNRLESNPSNDYWIATQNTNIVKREEKEKGVSIVGRNLKRETKREFASQPTSTISGTYSQCCGGDSHVSVITVEPNFDSTPHFQVWWRWIRTGRNLKLWRWLNRSRMWVTPLQQHGRRWHFLNWLSKYPTAFFSGNVVVSQLVARSAIRYYSWCGTYRSSADRKCFRFETLCALCVVVAHYISIILLFHLPKL